MIYRTYGRRGRGVGYAAPSRFGNGVQDSSSQDCSQDAFEFSFPSQESFPDPYKIDSSQELRPTRTFLEPELGREFDDDVWNLKKGKVIDLDSDTYCSSSGGEPQEFGSVEIIGFKQPRKTKNVVFDAPRSSHGVADFEILESNKCGKKRVRDGNGVLHKKRKKKKKVKSDVKDLYVELTSTLMETQEGGETMEHLDEINFALDGLKKGQQVRVHRASLLSLLSNCVTLQQRRLLRIHGMVKNIVDAIMGLNLEDPSSNLAAAAIFYILTCDGQDDHLLGSPSSIRFLVNMLTPIMSNPIKEKANPVGRKLLGLCKSAGFLPDSTKGKDSTSYAIMLKVREILVNCNELKPKKGVDGISEEPELNPKWISLRILEKACSSKISIEETSCTLRKPGGNFKEKLRQYGGLEAVFEVTRKCHRTMEDFLEKGSSSSLDSMDSGWVQGLVLLIRCLKIMENATFLSKDNQRHLLDMKGNYNGQKAPSSFVKLILSLINILSGASLLRRSESSVDDQFSGFSHEKVVSGLCSLELTSQKSCKVSQSSQSQLPADSHSVKLRFESSQTGSCSGASQNPEDVLGSRFGGDFEMAPASGKRQLITSNRMVEDIDDPFAFADDEFEPSKWDLMSGSVAKSNTRDKRRGRHGSVNVCESQLTQNELKSNMKHPNSEETSCSSTCYSNNSDLDDCLLTTVKVLMNLSNDNSEGCKQIAACGGLEILCSLVASHFPIYSSSYPNFNGMAPGALPSKSGHTDSHLTDQQLDFLVAILGCLVNLVEKDICNRSSLAKARVTLPKPDAIVSEDQIDVISLLCSIFLANQDAGGEAGQNEKLFSLEDEDSLLQGEKEAEKMIVEAYSALLLAFLSTESKKVRNSIAEHLPEGNLRILVPVLEKFVEFHRTLDVISSETHSAVLEVIESCRIP